MHRIIAPSVGMASLVLCLSVVTCGATAQTGGDRFAARAAETLNLLTNSDLPPSRASFKAWMLRDNVEFDLKYITKRPFWHVEEYRRVLIKKLGSETYEKLRKATLKHVESPYIDKREAGCIFLCEGLASVADTERILAIAKPAIEAVERAARDKKRLSLADLPQRELSLRAVIGLAYLGSDAGQPVLEMVLQDAAAPIRARRRVLDALIYLPDHVDVLGILRPYLTSPDIQLALDVFRPAARRFAGKPEVTETAVQLFDRVADMADQTERLKERDFLIAFVSTPDVLNGLVSDRPEEISEQQRATIKRGVLRLAQCAATGVRETSVPMLRSLLANDEEGIRQALRSQYSDVRCYAILAVLASARDVLAKFVPTLRRMLDDVDFEVKSNALLALRVYRGGEACSNMMTPEEFEHQRGRIEAWLKERDEKQEP